MNSEANNFHGEDSKREQEANGNQPSILEDKHKSSKNMSGPTDDKNGNSKGHSNHNPMKTEFCGTHTKKSLKKSESTNNKSKYDQGKSNMTQKSYQKSNNDASRNKDGENMQFKEDLKDGYGTTLQPLTGCTDKVYNEKKEINSMKKSTVDSILKSASVKNNSICKNTVDILETPVKCLDLQKDFESSRMSLSKENTQQVDKAIKILDSSAEQTSPNNCKPLKEMEKSNIKTTSKDNTIPGEKCATTDEKLEAKGKVSANENVEKNESIAVHNNVLENDAILRKYNIEQNGIETDKIKTVQGNIVKELVDVQPFSWDSKGIDTHKIENEHLKDDENIAFVEQNFIKASGIVEQHSFKNITNIQENVSQNRPITQNSLAIARMVSNPVPKILNTASEASASECSPNSKENNKEVKTDKQHNLGALNILSPVPLNSNSVSKNTVSSKKETPSNKFAESVASVQSYSLDEEPLKEKKLIKPDGPFIPPRLEYNIKYDEVQQSPPVSQSMKSNQSLYKISFNESITSSEANSRSSLSPLDPESQVPSSIVNDEIIVHEADTDSDAGSEDVEIIAHRYECETSLNRNKNLYVNKLSLAVELLRTQESLPYDAHFKRVVDDIDPSDENAIGEDNFGFEDDSKLINTKRGQEKIITNGPTKSNKLPGASSSVGNKNELTDSCEEAEEKRRCSMCVMS
ncbi:hypothetical protein JTE90_028810 [Oedothorax gibbosus]|uniref:Uncharacterized protein n=1 Tax=Oedothorax gibbosus TaxID=931172 RepID=A0AAV6VW06_9ARAC|nr:hypothetical protein JTE90_028810 [Oedothorax gibbosus]